MSKNKKTQQRFLSQYPQLVVGKSSSVFKSRYTLLIAVLICLFLVGGAAVILRRMSLKKNTPELLRYSGEDTSDKASLAAKYGKQYSETLQQTKNNSPTEWNKEAVDKASFSLIYADKTGAFTQVYELLSSLQSAKDSGVNIDNNSYGVTQRVREDIKLRTDARIKDFAEKHPGSQSE